jgi:hypothetical protein
MPIPLDCDLNQAVASEAAPSFQFDTHCAVRTNDGDELARTSVSRRGNQFHKQA